MIGNQTTSMEQLPYTSHQYITQDDSNNTIFLIYIGDKSYNYNKWTQANINHIIILMWCNIIENHFGKSIFKADNKSIICLITIYYTLFSFKLIQFHYMFCEIDQKIKIKIKKIIESENQMYKYMKFEHVS